MLIKLLKRAGGFSLIEVALAMLLLGIVAIALVLALATGAKSLLIADERTTAESLARSQMEYTKNLEYVYGIAEYPPAPIPNHPNYSAIINVEPVHNSDEGLQAITIIIHHQDKQVLTLEGYKTDR